MMDQAFAGNLLLRLRLGAAKQQVRDFLRHDHQHVVNRAVPVIEDFLAADRARAADMFFNQGLCLTDMLGRHFRQRIPVDRVRVCDPFEPVGRIPDEGRAAGHTGAEIVADGPRITARPLVMYSQPFAPQPSTTSSAPEFRTAKRTPAVPEANSLPLVAP
jgi:hypothetical protein